MSEKSAQLRFRDDVECLSLSLCVVTDELR